MQIIPSSPNVLTGPEAGVDLRMILKRWDNDIGSCHYQKALKKLQYLNMNHMNTKLPASIYRNSISNPLAII